MSPPLPVSRPPLRQALIVEDDPLFQRVIGEAFSALDEPWLMHAFRTGGEALTFCQAQGQGLDLALVDLGLPDISGEEVIRSLHARKPTAPIMVISVFSDEDKVLAAIRAGAVGYILIGNECFEITQAIRQVLDGQFPISPMVARYLFKLAAPVGAPPSGEQPRLSPRERVLLEHIAAGLTYAEAAQRMGLTLATVQSYSRNLFRKLDCHSQTQALARARASGLVS